LQAPCAVTHTYAVVDRYLVSPDDTLADRFFASSIAHAVGLLYPNSDGGSCAGRLDALAASLIRH
jgi:hypothetical protein